MTDSPTTPATKRGRNDQPPGQYYRCRPGRRIKRATEEVKRYLGVNRLTPDQKSAVALLVLPLQREY